MVIVKLVRDKDHYKGNHVMNDDYIWNLLRYIKYNKGSNDIRDDFRHIGGHGLDYHNIDHAYDNIMKIKKYWNNVNSKHKIIHYVVSLDYDRADNLEDAIKCGELCITYFKNKCRQCIYAIHEMEHEGGKYHIHIVVNPVSYKNGNLMGHWMNNVCEFVNWVKIALNLHNWEINNITENDIEKHYHLNVIND